MTIKRNRHTNTVTHPSNNRGRHCLTPVYHAVYCSSMSITTDYLYQIMTLFNLDISYQIGLKIRLQNYEYQTKSQLAIKLQRNLWYKGVLGGGCGRMLNSPFFCLIAYYRSSHICVSLTPKDSLSKKKYHYIIII